jgi:hypothetical protein
MQLGAVDLGSSFVSQSSLMANVLDVYGVDSAAALVTADAAMTVEVAGDGGVLLSKLQQQDDFAARRCSSAYHGNAAVAAPSGEWS